MIDTSAAGDRSLLRRMNSHAALLALREQRQTLTELAKRLGISRTAAEDVMRDLVALGWAGDTDDVERDARPGRPAKTYRFLAETGAVVGIDIGVHKVLAVAADLSGHILATRRFDVTEDLGMLDRLASAEAAVNDCLDAAGLRLDDVWAMGAGSPGVISPEGVVRRYGGNGLPGWVGLDLATRLSNRWGRPVVVDSDNTLGTIAEHWRGSARGARNVVYILSGNRTSAGLLVDGRVFRGHSGAVGLVGALPQLGWADAPSDVARLDAHGIGATREELFLAAATGEPAALAALDSFASHLALGVAAMSLAVDPELIVLGGGISRGGDVIVAAIRKHLDLLFDGAPPLTLSTLGDESVALGAVRLALDRIDSALLARVQTSSAFPPPSAREVL
ncbi:ROK family protein [Leifsonia poae]|uniref:ROK family protein n=1 Tax=Leifsonia poae TaxID=110933 RepID=UPI001CBB255B|nr:ROK family protein [Leifsonia poae]